MPDSTQASPAKERPKPKQAEQEQEVGNEFTMAMDSLTTAGNTSLSKQLKSRGNHHANIPTFSRVSSQRIQMTLSDCTFMIYNFLAPTQFSDQNNFEVR